jgi:hypothetical protein
MICAVTRILIEQSQVTSSVTRRGTDRKVHRLQVLRAYVMLWRLRGGRERERRRRRRKRKENLSPNPSRTVQTLPDK